MKTATKQNSKKRPTYQPPVNTLTVDGQKLLSPGAVARQFGISCPSLWRWTTKGFDVNGSRVVLAKLQLGKRLYFREADLLDFMLKTGAKAQAKPTARKSA